MTATYLGADGYDEAWTVLNGRLRDWSPEAISRESHEAASLAAELEKIDAGALTDPARVDRDVVRAQIAFVRRQAERASHQRCVDTYVAEPFRGLDSQLQQMSREPGSSSAGTESEWRRLLERTAAIPEYFEKARANLSAGVAAGNLPDHRMVAKDGISSAKELAEWLSKELAATASPLVSRTTFGPRFLGELGDAAKKAAESAGKFAAWLEESYGKDREDRFACGEAEYAWRVKSCLALDADPAKLWEIGEEETRKYEELCFETAAKISEKRKLGLKFATPDEKRASTRAVMDALSKVAPKTDAELFAWYRSACERAVEYGREKKLFDIPPSYRVEVVETPPVLRAGIDAAYYPAPPFKKAGIGRFYLTPTGDDPAMLEIHTKGYVADTAVHEGFPGHDWSYVFMNAHASEISPVRWLTPGAIEDSSSMWADSMASEGWGLYAEELMAEVGFYDEEEYLYELQGQLLRAARVKLDVGLHTRRMTYAEAIDWYSLHVNFSEKPCAAKSEQARALCGDAEHQIRRYSKWPTQAITYLMGKNEILALRERARARMSAKPGATYDARRFHEELLKQGTIPPGYYRDALLARLA